MLKFDISKKRKYLFMGGGLLLLLGVLYRFFPTIHDLKPADSEIILKKQQIAKYRQKIQKRKNLESRLTALNRHLRQSESGLLAGETPALAAVDVQNILSDITRKIDIEIKTMRVIKSIDLKNMNYVSIPVQFTLKSTVRQLKDLLYQIETSNKFLIINNMKIRNRSGKQPDQIESTVTVSGMLKKENE
jgi:hypothetical protein